LIRAIIDYYKQESEWEDCPYPISLWYTVQNIGFVSSILISLLGFTLITEERFPLKWVFVTLPALLQVLNLGWTVLGTFWAYKVIHESKECVIHT